MDIVGLREAHVLVIQYSTLFHSLNNNWWVRESNLGYNRTDEFNNNYNIYSHKHTQLTLERNAIFQQTNKQKQEYGT